MTVMLVRLVARMMIVMVVQILRAVEPKIVTESAHGQGR